jgi:hypothetical protein
MSNDLWVDCVALDQRYERRKFMRLNRLAVMRSDFNIDADDATMNNFAQPR